MSFGRNWRNEFYEPLGHEFYLGMRSNGSDSKKEWSITLRSLVEKFERCIGYNVCIVFPGSPDRRILVRLPACIVVAVGPRVDQICLSEQEYNLMDRIPKTHTQFCSTQQDKDRYKSQVSGRSSVCRYSKYCIQRPEAKQEDSSH